MKRFFTLFIAIILTISMTLITSAISSTETTINNSGFSVTFKPDSVFSSEEQQVIVDRIVTKDTGDNSSSTYNLMCTLFGHKTVTESVTVIEHCVSDTQPRCVRSLQDVTGCTRCDYVTIDVVSSMYIFCCD